MQQLGAQVEQGFKLLKYLILPNYFIEFCEFNLTILKYMS